VVAVVDVEVAAFPDDPHAVTTNAKPAPSSERLRRFIFLPSEVSPSETFCSNHPVGSSLVPKIREVRPQP
jgi:hypothetical protein